MGANLSRCRAKHSPSWPALCHGRAARFLRTVFGVLWCLPGWFGRLWLHPGGIVLTLRRGRGVRLGLQVRIWNHRCTPMPRAVSDRRGCSTDGRSDKPAPRDAGAGCNAMSQPARRLSPASASSRGGIVLPCRAHRGGAMLAARQPHTRGTPRVARTPGSRRRALSRRPRKTCRRRQSPVTTPVRLESARPSPWGLVRNGDRPSERYRRQMRSGPIIAACANRLDGSIDFTISWATLPAHGRLDASCRGKMKGNFLCQQRLSRVPRPAFT